ncbi:MAG TPA: hypothetical protein VG652_00955 [Gaiellaceae bacterium]|nr:hypothetical protein [Gaiellaceae bacterium]
MRRIFFGLTVLAAVVAVPVASASQVISTSTVSNLTLGVNSKGQAMLSYVSKGTTVHVLAYGAVNASPPTQGQKQVALTLDYDGGYKENYTNNPAAKAAVANLRSLQDQMKKATAAKNNPARYALAPKISAAYAKLAALRTAATDYWKTFTCPAYNGPALAWMTAACKAPDGSYWAVQEWQRQLPDYGVTPTPVQAATEVHLAHWTGALPVLTVTMNWAYKKFDHLFGTFTYNGTGVYGFASTPGGAPLDTWGRNLYVDTFDSAYGKGWERDNSFLTHKPGGSFCYGFYAHGSFPAGNGTKYRATIIGPGLTPDIEWQGDAPGPFDPVAQATADAAIVAMNDPQCKQV